MQAGGRGWSPPEARGRKEAEATLSDGWEGIEGLGIGALLGIVVFPPVILIAECVMWLYSGSWPALSLSTWLPYIGMTWSHWYGIRYLVNGFLDLPLAASAFLAGAIQS